MEDLGSIESFCISEIYTYVLVWICLFGRKLKKRKYLLLYMLFFFFFDDDFCVCFIIFYFLIYNFLWKYVLYESYYNYVVLGK